LGYGLVFACLAAFLWGVAPILQKRALRDVGLLEMNALRGLGILAAFIPAYFFLRASVLLPRAEFYGILMIVALINNLIGDIFAFIAIRHIGASLAVPVTSSYPLLIALISWLWFGETLSFGVLTGTLIVVAGLVLLNLRGATTAAPRSCLRGLTAATAAALCWAFGLSLNKYLTLRGLTPTAIIYWRGIWFSLMALGNWGIFRALRPATTRSPRDIPPIGALAGALSGLMSLVVGTWCYTVSITLIPMSVATPIGAVSPLLTALGACIFMGESLRPVQWLGIFFMVAGAVMVGS
jgi:DME family drug/metabolite transporter